jgi:IclR family acetate operon transcriptional repressor
VSLAATSARDVAKPTYLIGSVDSALRLLHLVLERERIRITEAAAELGVAASTAHRLFAMLQYHGFVAQDERTHEYVRGPDLVRFGLAALQNMDIREQARPIMERLAAQTGETVALGTLQGANVLYVDGCESASALRVAVRTGSLIPAHAIAMGKALLAWIPAERLNQLYPNAKLPPITDRTLGTKADLAADLASIRRRGYAQSRGESAAGVASIAVPVHNHTGDLRAALSIAAPALRLPPERSKAFVQLLLRAATELGAQCR